MLEDRQVSRVGGASGRGRRSRYCGNPPTIWARASAAHLPARPPKPAQRGESHHATARERREDLDLLIQYSLACLNTELDGQIVGMSDEATQLFYSSTWPATVLGWKTHCAGRFCWRHLIQARDLPLA